jgi:uncharacterized membrane protein
VDLGNHLFVSPIVAAIKEAEEKSTAHVRVHLSKRWIETRPFSRASKIFNQYEMNNTPQRNSVLFYVNLRRKKFAILGDSGIHQLAGPRFWEKLAKELTENLRSTQSEKAIALAIQSTGEMLKKLYPNPNKRFP